MRNLLKRYLPKHDTVHTNRWLRPFANTLLHPRLWHLNRHSVAGAVALGLACGLIPGPFQMISAAIGCILFRVNLPLALATTLYSNPITIVPLYMVAYAYGAMVSGSDPDGFVHPPEMGDMGLFEWMATLLPWLVSLGKPLAIGLVLLAVTLALIGYFTVRAAWRVHLMRAWRARAMKRATTARPPT